MIGSMVANAAVGQAEKTLSRSLQILPDPDVEANVATYRGRRYAHWSQYVTLGVAVAGTAMAVAAFVLSQPAVLVVGVVLATSNGVAAFYLWKFVPLKALEGYLKILTREVDRFGRALGDLRKIHRDLEQFDNSLRKLLEQERQAGESLHKKLEKRLEELQRANELLAEKEKELCAVSALYEQLKGVAERFRADAAQFNENRLAFEGDLQELREQLKASSTLEQEIKTNTAELAKENAHVAENIDELAAFATELETQLAVMCKVHEQLKQERDALKLEIDRLEKAQERAVKEAEELRKAAEAMTKASENIEKRRDEVRKLNDDLSELPDLTEILRRREERRASGQ